MRLISIGIAERPDGALAAALRRELERREIPAILSPCAAGGRYDLLLCAELSAFPAGTAARALAVSDSCAAEVAARCAAEAVVTCGLDARCTLTPSSLLPGGEMAALQREMASLSGAVCLPQELPLPPAGSAGHRLLLAAALLALGEGAR